MLDESVKAYRRLINYEYEIVAGRKSKLFQFVICFCLDDFYHLAGFHYVDTIQAFRNRSDVFTHIDSGSISDALIEKSKCANLIFERLQCILGIEEMMESCDFLIQFNPNIVRGSQIDAKYIIIKQFQHGNTYLFLNGDTNGIVCPASIFVPLNEPMYRNGQSTLKLLRVTRVDKTTGLRTDVFISPVFRHQAAASE